MLDMNGLLCAIFSASSRVSAVTMVKPVMESDAERQIFRAAFGDFPAAAEMAAHVGNAGFHRLEPFAPGAMISGVGFSNP